MAWKGRSIFACDTDYVGATIDDIIEEIKYFKGITQDTINSIEEVLTKMEPLEPHYLNVNIEGDLKPKIASFKSYIFNFDRLIKELPGCVTQGHCDLLKQITSKREMDLYLCKTFRDQNIEQIIREGEDDNAKKTRIINLVEYAHNEIKDTLITYGDLGTLKGQLQTYVGVKTKPSKEKKGKQRATPKISPIDTVTWKRPNECYILQDHDNRDKQTSVSFYVIWKNERKKLLIKEGGHMHSLFNVFISRLPDGGIVNRDDMKNYLGTKQAPSKAIEDLNKALVNKLRQKKCDVPDIIVGYSQKRNGYVSLIPIMTGQQLEDLENHKQDRGENRQDVEEHFGDGFQIERRGRQHKHKK